MPPKFDPSSVVEVYVRATGASTLRPALKGEEAYTAFSDRPELPRFQIFPATCLEALTATTDFLVATLVVARSNYC